VDLLFPHHENERLQTEAALDGGPHVGYWVHNGLVTVAGAKMSKSLGNGADLAALLDRYGAPALRGYLLSVHYRSPLEYSEAGLRDFQRGLARVERLWDQVKDADPASEPVNGQEGDVLTQFPLRLDDALDADFNTPAAFGHLFDMVRAANTLLAKGVTSAAGLARRNLTMANAALGLWPAVPASAPAPSPPPAVLALVRERDAARQAGDYGRADALREQLQQQGWTVEDGRDGAIVRPLEVP